MFILFVVKTWLIFLRDTLTFLFWLAQYLLMVKSYFLIVNS